MTQRPTEGKKTRPERTGLRPGVVGGERVLIADAPIVEREKAIEIRIRGALAAAGVLVWKHHVDNRKARTGLAIGAADLICVVPPLGRFLAIEVKRPSTRARTSDNQDRFLAVVRRFGGVSGVATTVEEAMALVEIARSAP